MGAVLAILMSIQGVSTTQAFTGTWVLDPGRSVLRQGSAREIELVVVDDRSTVKVRERRQSGVDEYAVALDGKPHEHRTAAGDPFVRVLRRENGVLLFQVTMTRLSDNASMTYTERWSLSDSDRTLTVYSAYPVGLEMVKVFARKD